MPNEIHSEINQHSPRGNPWAIASLFCSLAIFCPVLTVLAPLFGLRALVQIKTNPKWGGKRMAVTGIVIGVAATIAWACGAIWWHVNARTPMLNGPQEALHAGLAGDMDGFRSGFHGEAANASDTEIATFLGELSRRYGLFIGSSVDRSIDPPSSDQSLGALEIAYQLQFEQESVQAIAQFIVTENARPPFILKFGWLKIVDPDRGELMFPAGLNPLQ